MPQRRATSVVLWQPLIMRTNIDFGQQWMKANSGALSSLWRIICERIPLTNTIFGCGFKPIKDFRSSPTCRLLIAYKHGHLDLMQLTHTTISMSFTSCFGSIELLEAIPNTLKSK